MAHSAQRQSRTHSPGMLSAIIRTSYVLFIGRETNDASRTTGRRDSPACSGGDTGLVREFARLIRCLGLDESKQTFVFLRGSKKLEGDAASADRIDHRGQFKRKLAVSKGQLQIEDVARMDLGLALDDTTAHREVEYRSLATNLAPGE